MLKLRKGLLWIPLLGAMLMAGSAGAQSYPGKPVRIVTAGAGSAGDVASRLVAQGLTGLLGQQVVVDNRSSSVIPVEVVVKSPADGYTLLLYGNVIWLSPFLLDKVSYDPVRDLSPVTLVGTSPNILVVHPSLPVKSVKELIALARARPGELNYASGGSGSSSHLSGELFKAMAGVNIVRIQYKSGGVAMSDLLGGHVLVYFAAAAGVTPHAKAGRLRALAVTSARPSVVFPGLPSVAESGLSGYESGSMFSLMAPAKTPDAVISRLHQESARYLTSTEGRERFLNVGVETVASTPGQLAAAIKSEMSRMGKVIREAGIRGE